jgi:arginase
VTNRVYASPFFLDQPAPALTRLAGADGDVNRAVVDGTTIVERMAAPHEALAAWTAATVLDGARPMAFVGDCCQSIGLVAGLQRAGLDPAIVWLDAHGDFNTYETTITGFLGGMPLAMLVGRGDQGLLRSVSARPVVESDVHLADARDLDPAERMALESSLVRRAAVADVVAGLPRDQLLYVHFDVDVLDPSYAPAMRYRVPGGPALRVVEQTMADLAATGRVAAVSMTVWDLEADRDGATERACLATLARLIGPR